MYESHFGFTEKPFNLTPDPKYLYLSQRHADAFAHLEFGRRERGGFVVVTGEVGTGKTTLARYFLGRLGDDTASAVVLYPALTAAELLRSILDDLHVTTTGSSLKELVDALHRFLLDSRQAGRHVVLLIDEAQDLSAEVLEQIRLISNLETDTEKLITIVLMGQSELREMLGRHELRQLAQRVTARYHLTALGRAETEDYVRHRLEVAGGSGKVAFTAPAMAAVQRLSGGLPRLVNLLCDRALLAGYVAGVRTITEPMLRRAAREALGPGPRTRLSARALLRVAAVLAAAAALLAIGAGVGQRASGAGPAAAAVPEDASATPPAAATRSPLETLLVSLSGDASRVAALETLVLLWAEPALVQTEIQTHLAHIVRLDLPVVLEMFHPTRRDTCYLALVGLRGDAALVSAGAAPLSVRLDELNRFWTRRALFAWSQPADQGSPDWVQETLLRLGHLDPGGDVPAAVRRFQQHAELAVDGVVGPQTLVALYGLGELERPRLRDGPS